MKQLTCFFFILIVLSSCSTLFHQLSYPVFITSNEEGASAIVNDSIYELPSFVRVERSKKDLHIQLNTDSVSRNYVVKSSVSPRFLYDNLFWLYGAPIGYLIDYTNPKRFYYGKNIFLDVKKNDEVLYTPLEQHYRDFLYKQYPNSKGQINLNLSLPWVNHFFLKPQNETLKSHTGFMGFAGVLEYFYINDQFLSVRMSRHTDYFFLFPVPMEMFGPYDRMFSTTFSIYNNTQINRFTYGYGLSYFENTWKHYIGAWFQEDEINRNHSLTSRSVGFMLNGYWQMSNNAFIGFTYQPSVWKIIPETKFEYEHLLSLDLVWKMKIFKGRH